MSCKAQTAGTEADGAEDDEEMVCGESGSKDDDGVSAEIALKIEQLLSILLSGIVDSVMLNAEGMSLSNSSSNS